jgi:hypothetical protein
MPVDLFHPAPLGFGDKGAALWESYASRYQLRADELRYLEDACRLADVLGDLQSAARGAQTLVKGSMGQDVLNPLIAEQKTFATSIAGLLARIKLPVQKAAAAGDRSSSARKAANARWSRGA